MKEVLRQHAFESRFDDCRFTSATPPEFREHFRRWLEAQRQGEMGYLQRTAHKRVDPQQILTGARTIICLAASYWMETPNSPGDRRASNASELSSVSAGVQRQTAVFAAKQHRSQPVTADSPAPPSVSRSPHLHGNIGRYARFADYHNVLGVRLRHLAALVN